MQKFRLAVGRAHCRIAKYASSWKLTPEDAGIYLRNIISKAIELQDRPSLSENDTLTEFWQEICQEVWWTRKADATGFVEPLIQHLVLARLNYVARFGADNQHPETNGPVLAQQLITNWICVMDSRNPGLLPALAVGKDSQAVTELLENGKAALLATSTKLYKSVKAGNKRGASEADLEDAEESLLTKKMRSMDLADDQEAVDKLADRIDEPI